MLNYTQALVELKNGKTVRRKAWGKECAIIWHNNDYCWAKPTFDGPRATDNLAGLDREDFDAEDWEIVKWA